MACHPPEALFGVRTTNSFLQVGASFLEVDALLVEVGNRRVQYTREPQLLRDQALPRQGAGA